MAAVDKAVDDAVAGLDAHLLDVLFTKYQLRQHLDAIKRYLLLGQGDFIETFMGLVGADLDRPVYPAVFSLVLQFLLRHAVVQTYAGACRRASFLSMP